MGTAWQESPACVTGGSKLSWPKAVEAGHPGETCGSPRPHVALRNLRHRRTWPAGTDRLNEGGLGSPGTRKQEAG